jgi:hypothetical protein
LSEAKGPRNSAGRKTAAMARKKHRAETKVKTQMVKAKLLRNEWPVQ